MHEVFVGLGSNIEPERHIPCAVHTLAGQFGPLRESPVYRSPAFGMQGPDFLNLVVAFETDRTRDDIERVLTELEADSGRVRSGTIASRTLDLDLLICGATVAPEARLPRDDVLRYPFVLCPLNDIAPDLRHPVTGETIAAAWARLAAAAHELVCIGSVADLAGSGPAAADGPPG